MDVRPWSTSPQVRGNPRSQPLASEALPLLRPCLRAPSRTWGDVAPLQTIHTELTSGKVKQGFGKVSPLYQLPTGLTALRAFQSMEADKAS